MIIMLRFLPAGDFTSRTSRMLNGGLNYDGNSQSKYTFTFSVNSKVDFKIKILLYKFLVD